MAPLKPKIDKRKQGRVKKFLQEPVRKVVHKQRVSGWKEFHPKDGYQAGQACSPQKWGVQWILAALIEVGFYQAGKNRYELMQDWQRVRALLQSGQPRPEDEDLVETQRMDLYLADVMDEPLTPQELSKLSVVHRCLRLACDARPGKTSDGGHGPTEEAVEALLDRAMAEYSSTMYTRLSCIIKLRVEPGGALWLPPSFRSERVRQWLKERVLRPMWGRGPEGMVQGWRLWGEFSTHQRHHNWTAQECALLSAYPPLTAVGTGTSSNNSHNNNNNNNNNNAIGGGQGLSSSSSTSSAATDGSDNSLGPPPLSEMQKHALRGKLVEALQGDHAYAELVFHFLEEPAFAFWIFDAEGKSGNMSNRNARKRGMRAQKDAVFFLLQATQYGTGGNST